MTNVVQLRTKPDAHPADDLSFMKRRKPRGGGINYWNVKSTGNHGKDYARGKALAREYLTYIGQHHTYGNSTLLGCIVNDMVHAVDGGPLRGTEMGFLQGINDAAMILAAYVPQAVQS